MPADGPNPAGATDAADNEIIVPAPANAAPVVATAGQRFNIDDWGTATAALAPIADLRDFIRRARIDDESLGLSSKEQLARRALQLLAARDRDRIATEFDAAMRERARMQDLGVVSTNAPGRAASRPSTPTLSPIPARADVTGSTSIAAGNVTLTAGQFNSLLPAASAPKPAPKRDDNYRTPTNVPEIDVSKDAWCPYERKMTHCLTFCAVMAAITTPSTVLPGAHAHALSIIAMSCVGGSITIERKFPNGPAIDLWNALKQPALDKPKTVLLQLKRQVFAVRPPTDGDLLHRTKELVRLTEDAALDVQQVDPKCKLDPDGHMQHLLSNAPPELGHQVELEDAATDVPTLTAAMIRIATIMSKVAPTATALKASTDEAGADPLDGFPAGTTVQQLEQPCPIPGHGKSHTLGQCKLKGHCRCCKTPLPTHAALTCPKCTSNRATDKSPPGCKRAQKGNDKANDAPTTTATTAAAASADPPTSAPPTVAPPAPATAHAAQTQPSCAQAAANPTAGYRQVNGQWRGPVNAATAALLAGITIAAAPAEASKALFESTTPQSALPDIDTSSPRSLVAGTALAFAMAPSTSQAGLISDSGAGMHITSSSFVAQHSDQFYHMPSAGAPTTVQFANGAIGRVVDVVGMRRDEPCADGATRVTTYGPMLVVAGATANLISENFHVLQTDATIVVERVAGAAQRSARYPGGKVVRLPTRRGLHWLPAWSARHKWPPRSDVGLATSAEPELPALTAMFPTTEACPPESVVQDERDADIQFPPIPGMPPALAGAARVNAVEHFTEVSPSPAPHRRTVHEHDLDFAKQRRRFDGVNAASLQRRSDLRSAERKRAALAFRTRQHSRECNYTRALLGYRSDKCVLEAAKSMGTRLTGRDRLQTHAPRAPPAPAALGKQHRRNDPPQVTTTRKPREMLCQDPVVLKTKTVSGNDTFFFTSDPGAGRVRVMECGAKTSTNAIAAVDDYIRANMNEPGSADWFPRLLQTGSDNIYGTPAWASMLRKHHAWPRKSAPMRHRGNFLIEKKIGVIFAPALAQLYSAPLHHLGRDRDQLIGCSLRHAALIDSKLPTGNSPSPYEVETGLKPSFTDLPAPFGSKCYVCAGKSARGHKLGARSRYGIYLGNSPEHPEGTYIVCCPGTKRIIVARDVAFDYEPSTDPVPVPDDNEFFEPYTPPPPPPQAPAPRPPPREAQRPFGLQPNDPHDARDEGDHSFGEPQHLEPRNQHAAPDPEPLSLRHADGTSMTLPNTTPSHSSSPSSFEPATPELTKRDELSPAGLSTLVISEAPVASEAVSNSSDELACFDEPSDIATVEHFSDESIARIIYNDHHDATVVSTLDGSAAASSCSVFNWQLPGAAAASSAQLHPDLPKPPRSMSEAKRMPNAQHRAGFVAAIEREFSGLVSRGVWDPTNSTPPPAGATPLGTQLLCSHKFDERGNVLYKARLVVLGNRQKYGIDYVHTSSPVPNQCAMSCFFAVAAIDDLELTHLGAKQAFTLSPIDIPTWIRLPGGVLFCWILHLN